MAGDDQRPPESLWLQYDAEIDEVYEDEIKAYKLDLSYLSLRPGSIKLNGVASLVDQQGLTKYDKYRLQQRVKQPDGSSREAPIKVTGKPEPGGGQQGGAGAGAGASAASPSQIWKTEFEGDVFYYSVCGEDGVKERVGEQFYIDSECKVAIYILRWAAQVSRRFSCKGTTPQRPLVILGLPKTGKTATATTFLPALLHTYGISDHTPLLSGGAMPPPPAKPEGLAWSLWMVNCVGFQRTQGKDGFLVDLLKSLKDQAVSLGFSAAIRTPNIDSPVGPFNDIMSSLRNLPSDRLHVIVVDEVQNFFLLERKDGGGILDADKVRDMRRSFKQLIAMAPPHVVWVFTSSLSNMLIANIAEAPVSGYALLNFCHFLHLSSSVPDHVMSLAWSQLKRRSPSLPEDLLLFSFKNHAMLSHLCEEWLAALNPMAPHELFQYVLERKLLPEIEADLRGVLLLLEAKGTYWGGLDSVRSGSQLQQLVMALDPFQGVPRGSLHRYFEEALRPYLRSVGDEADTPPDSDLVFVDCYIYQHLLKMVTTADGKLRDFPIGGKVPWASSYWEGERLRQFGELVNAAKKNGFNGYDEVQELLQHMAKCLGTDISEQRWYQEVLNHSVTRKAKKQPPAGLTAVDTVQWGMIQLRHCLSHEVGSHSTLLRAREDLPPFAPRMDEVRLKHLLKPAKKPPPGVKAMAMLRARMGIHSRSSVPNTRRLVGRAV